MSEFWCVLATLIAAWLVVAALLVGVVTIIGWLG